MGSYQGDVAKNEVNKLPVTAHIYEYTSLPPQDLRARDPLHGSPDPGVLMRQREDPKEDQLAPLVIQCLWARPPTERLRLMGHAARPDTDIPPLEGVRHQLQR
ncbi:hypothetical protein H0H92_009726 [Tricholoma furcatifolium]|nr:hypothetical protein H0H92_009726 [Tricholoma furcatifolium]